MLRYTLLLVGLVACSAATCPSFMHSVSATEKKAILPLGVAIFQNYAQDICESLPYYITEPAYYKAVVTPQCVTSDLTTAQFSYNFKPRTPCKCEPPYCKQTSAGCECTVPRNFNVTKVELVYTQPQDCLKFGLAIKWNNVSYDLGGTTTNEACPVGYKTATTANRVLVVGLLSQAMKSYVWPKVKGTPDGDIYYCPEGVKSMVYPGNIKTYKSCISKDGTSAIVRGPVQFVCAQQARIRTVSVVANVQYVNTCYPKLYDDDK